MLTDEQLVQRAQKGSPEEFEELARRYAARLHAFCRRSGATQEEALDLAQETLVRAYQGLPRFRAGAQFAPWLLGIAAKVCADLFRKERRMGAAMLDPSASQEVLSGLPAVSEPGPKPGERLEAEEMNAAVQKAVAALPERYRQVVILRFGQEMSCRQIGDALRITQAAAAKRLARALEMLRPKLKGIW